MGETICYERHDAVALISLNRPDALNGFTTGMCAELGAALQTARDDEAVRAVVLTGEGRCFSTGADLKAGLEDRPDLAARLQNEFRPPMQAIADIPKPVIAAVPGFAAGIGLAYVLYSDLVVMAEDAFLLSPFTTISLVPDGGACWLLVRQLGYHRAFQLSIESERIGAERCLELGLANKVVPAGELRETAVAWGNVLAKRAPLSIAATKKVMRYAMDNDWADCYDMEAELQGRLAETEDMAEGVAAFFDKRAPQFKGK